MWKRFAEHLGNYISYPRVVGETGGKDFIFVHNSANPLEVATAIISGSFEYQDKNVLPLLGHTYLSHSGRKSKKTYWNRISKIKVGDVTDFNNYVNAVIDEPSFDRIMNYIDLAKKSKECEIIAGGSGDKSIGYFIQPTIIETSNPYFTTMQRNIAGL